MNKTILVLQSLILATVLLGACGKTEEPTLSKQQDVSKDAATDQGGDLRSQVAEGVASMGLDLKDVELVAGAIKSAVNDGHDEFTHFHKFLSEGSLRSSDKGNFASKLTASLNTQLKSSLRNGNGNVLDLLKDESLGIYWLNASSWDGTTLPTIAVAKDLIVEDAGEDHLIEAFELNPDGSTKRTIRIDEKYALDHPVWVIDRKLIDDDAIILKPIENSIIAPIDWEPISIGDIASVTLGQIQATRYYDPWYKGGPELMFKASFPLASINLSTGGINVSERTTKFVIELTREDVKKERIKTYNQVLIPEWQKGINEFGFLVYEQDDSLFSSKEEIKFNFGFKGFTFSTSFYISGADDHIYNTTYTRNFMRSTANFKDGKWQFHRADGLRWTMPYKRETITIIP